MVTGTSPPGALASISIPPSPGGEPLGGRGEGTADTPPNDACCASAACQDDGHVHQLFRQLRHTKCSAVRDHVLKRNLGHLNNLLGQTPVEDLQDIHQMFHHLRHKSVKIEHRHKHEGQDHLLHGVPLDPLLRPWLSEWSQPQIPGSSLYNWKSSGFLAALGVGLRGALCAASALAVFCPRGASFRSLSAVVSGHRQCHGDGLPLVTPLSAQPPLPPPPRKAPGVASSHALLPARVHPMNHHQTHVRGQAWVRRLLLNEWFLYSKRIIIVRSTELSDDFFVDFRW